METRPLTDEFKQFISTELSLTDFKIVHYQLKSNQKVLLLRLRRPRSDLCNKRFEFRNLQITLTELVRPIVSAINIIESVSIRLQKLGKTKLKLSKFAVVFVNNFPDSAQKSDVLEAMAKFGKVDRIEIHEKGEMKGGKRLRCRLGTVYFDSIDGAVSAFYHDKVEIKGCPSKIKLYLNVQKVKGFLKKKKLLPKNFFQIEFQNEKDGSNHNSNSTTKIQTGRAVHLYDQLGHLNPAKMGQPESKNSKSKAKQEENMVQNSLRPQCNNKRLVFPYSNQKYSSVENQRMLKNLRQVDPRFKLGRKIRLRTGVEIEACKQEYHSKEIRVNVMPLEAQNVPYFEDWHHEASYENFGFSGCHQTSQYAGNSGFYNSKYYSYF